MARAHELGDALRVLEYDAPAVTPEQFVRAVGAGTSFVFAPPDGPALAAAGIARLFHPASPELAPRTNVVDHPAVRVFCAFPFPDPRPASRALERGLCLLPRWQLCAEGGRTTALLLAPAGTSRADADDEWRRIAARLGTSSSPPLPRVLARSAPDDGYRGSVAEAMQAIARGELEKVVLARRALLSLAGPLEPLALLERLAGEAGFGCRLAVQHAGDAFVAATPERLCRLTGRRVETEALAGTLDRASAGGALLLESGKDVSEHALVVRDLAARLRPITSRLDVPRTPGLRTLRHVEHLHTPIAGELSSSRHALEIAALLFPTPAVCGLPREAALAWIQRHEELPRGLYAGLVGWFDGRGDGDFWVGLRGATVSGNLVEQRVGAGLVEGSDPDGEFAETEAKQRGLLRALGAQP